MLLCSSKQSLLAERSLLSAATWKDPARCLITVHQEFRRRKAPKAGPRTILHSKEWDATYEPGITRGNLAVAGKTMELQQKVTTSASPQPTFRNKAHQPRNPSRLAVDYYTVHTHCSTWKTDILQRSMQAKSETQLRREWMTLKLRRHKRMEDGPAQWHCEGRRREVRKATFGLRTINYRPSCCGAPNPAGSTSGHFRLHQLLAANVHLSYHDFISFTPFKFFRFCWGWNFINDYILSPVQARSLHSMRLCHHINIFGEARSHLRTDHLL